MYYSLSTSSKVKVYSFYFGILLLLRCSEVKFRSVFSVPFASFVQTKAIVAMSGSDPKKTVTAQVAASDEDGSAAAPAAAEEWEIQRDEFKASGDAAFRSGKYAAAVASYTQALALDPENGVLLSNRSAAYLGNNEKSRALHDAIACLPTMGIKGMSRHAAALQALGRHGAALQKWDKILLQDASHVAATAGRDACNKAILLQREKDAEEATKQAAAEKQDKHGDEDDDLEDFFNDVEEAAETVVQEKNMAAQQNAIKSHRKDLGTAVSQMDRLLRDNCEWYNLNPFYVLDLPHTATADEIAKRYKALSLLLHPDKNPGLEKAQDALDQVLRAKDTLLKDENKANHLRNLIQRGLEQGQIEFEQASGKDAATAQAGLEEFQRKAVFKLFADIEHSRRQVEKREQAFFQREQKHEDDTETAERNARKFDKQWKESERVDKRIGNWRDFQKKKKPKL
jgi:DnaJ homolog subfamily C member 8